MNYLVDTHAFLWYFSEDQRLGKNVEEILLQGERGKHTIVLPTIVLAEAEAISNKYGYNRKFLFLIAKLSEIPSFVVYPFDSVVLDEYFKIKTDLEIHDRIIVAIAKITNSVILTKDREIRKLKNVEVVW